VNERRCTPHSAGTLQVSEAPGTPRPGASPCPGSRDVLRQWRRRGRTPVSTAAPAASSATPISREVSASPPPVRASVPPVPGSPGTRELLDDVLGGVVLGSPVVLDPVEGGVVPGSPDESLGLGSPDESLGLGSPDEAPVLPEPGSWVHPLGGCWGSHVAPPAGSEATGLASLSAA